MTSIVDILGEKCIFKRLRPSPQCNECSGYKGYAESVGCQDYISPTEHKQYTSFLVQRIMLGKIRNANDMGVVA